MKQWLRVYAVALTILVFLTHYITQGSLAQASFRQIDEQKSTNGSPSLSIPEEIISVQEATVSVPIQFNNDGESIAATDFSIDYDESCLTFNSVNIDGDSIFDEVTFNLPAQLIPDVTFNPDDSDGELDFVIVDYAPPFAILPTSIIVTINFLVTCSANPGESTIAPIRFSTVPTASFSDDEANDIDGTTLDGSVKIIFGTPPPTNTFTPLPPTITNAPTPSPTPLPTETATHTPEIALETPSIPEGPIATVTMTPTAAETPTPQPTTISNHPPNAVDDIAATDSDVPIEIDVLANDSDPDNDPLQIASLTQGSHGSVFPLSNGQLQYRPNPAYSGSDSFRYTLYDGRDGTDTATVNITIRPVNHRPHLVDDTVITDEDTSVTLDVLANDSDPDGDSLSIIAISQGRYGDVVLNNDNSVTYQPDPNYNGSDDFTYTAGDGNGETQTAIVKVTVNPIADEPIAIRDAVILQTAGGESVTIDSLGNDINLDGGVFDIINVSQPSNGTTILNLDDTIQYTRNPGFVGTDQFTYTAELLQTNRSENTPQTIVVGLVTVIVDPKEGLVIAGDDSVTTDEDVSVTLNVLQNDQNNLEDSDLFVFGVNPGDGLVIINEDESFTYFPPLDASGLYTFTYVVGNNGQGVNTGADVGTVFVTINAVNDAPHAQPDEVNTEEEKFVVIDVLANDEDIDSDTVRISTMTQGEKGDVTFHPNGLLYTPQKDFVGTDRFGYTVEDSQGAKDTTVVFVSVSNVNDAPEANIDLVVTGKNQSVTIRVLENDRDVDGDILSVTEITRAEYGGVLLATNNRLTYFPNWEYIGSDQFIYTISDGQLSTKTNVKIAVLPTVPLELMKTLYLPMIYGK